MMKNFFSNVSQIFLFLILFPFSSSAQEKGSFVFRGQVQKADKIKKRDVSLANATVELYKNEIKIKFVKTGKDGEFEFTDLEYGTIYKAVFKSSGCIEMFLLIDANVPAKKLVNKLGVQSNFIMYDTHDKEINSKKFNYPFMKIAFNGKDLAIDDKYIKDFNNDIIPEMQADEQKSLADQKLLAEKQVKEKQEAEQNEKKRKEEDELRKKMIKIAGKLLVGENPSKPIVNVNVMLVNDKQEVVQNTTTNFMGSFVFNVFLPGNNYSIKVDESNNQVPPNAIVIFTGKNDKEVGVMNADIKGKFVFKIFPNNVNIISLITLDDSELKIDIKGKLLSGDDPAKKPLINVKVNLMNKTAEIIQSSKTDKDGLFVFKYIGVDKNYIISLDETDPQISLLKKLILADEKGNTVKEVQSDKDKHFKFELLPNEVNKMGKMYVDDPWLKIMDPRVTLVDGLVISENVYFNVNDEKLLPDAKQTLDKVIAIMNGVPDVSIEISSHTDSQGADDYNLKLSERRAKAAVDYMVSHGISATRITGKGYGETRLLNKCSNGVKCTEEEHAKNRRLEFKVIKK